MSGGYFNYWNDNLKSEIFRFSDKPYNALEDREISELVFDVLNLLHDYDWYVSGDTDRSSYLKSKRVFKKKWFTSRGIRVREIVDAAIQDAKQELYDTFDLGEADTSDV